MERSIVFNLLSRLEVEPAISGRAYRKLFGRKDSHYRYLEVDK